MGDLEQQLEKHMAELLSSVDPNLVAPGQTDDQWADDLTDEDKSQLSLVQTLRDTVFVFNGPMGLARELKLTYDAAPKGSNTRARIVERIIQSVQDYGEDENLDDEESVDALDDHLRVIHREELMERLPENLKSQVAEYLE